MDTNITKPEKDEPKVIDIIADTIDPNYTTADDFATLFFEEHESKILADPQSALIPALRYHYNRLRSEAAIRHKTLCMALDGDEKALNKIYQWSEKQKLRNLLA